MTIADVIEKLSALDNKNAPVFIDCSHCGKAMEFGELKEIVLVRAKSGEKTNG